MRFKNLRYVAFMAAVLGLTLPVWANHHEMGGATKENMVKMLPAALQPAYQAGLAAEKAVHAAHQSGDHAAAKTAELTMANKIKEALVQTKNYLPTANDQERGNIGKVLQSFDKGMKPAPPGGMPPPPSAAPAMPQNINQLVDKMIMEIDNQIVALQSGQMPPGGPGMGPGTGMGPGHGSGMGPGHGSGMGPGHGSGMGSPGMGPGTGMSPGHGSGMGSPGMGTKPGPGMGTRNIPPECSETLRTNEQSPQQTNIPASNGKQGNLLFRTVCNMDGYDQVAISLPSDRQALDFDIEAATGPPSTIVFGIRVEGGADVYHSSAGPTALHSLNITGATAPVYTIYLDRAASAAGARVTVRFMDTSQ